MNLGAASLNADTGRLGAEEFAACFGVSPANLPAQCLERINQADFSFRRVQGRERDRVILDVLKRLHADVQKIGAPERRDTWERGWREALNEYVDSSHSPSKLVPKFIRPNQPVRLNQDYVIPSDQNMELSFVEVLREWMFREFFAEASEVHEFGCGTGFNLVTLAGIYPDKQLYGSDFVPASVELVNRIAQHKRLNLSARLFDMITPPEDYGLNPGAAVYTFGALEQLASKYERFLAFLLARKPAICLHVEPTVELYDDNNIVDYLAIRFHRQRGYTEGFLPRLRTLAAQKKVELLTARRMNFGSMMMEGYNLIVWRPIG